MAIKHDHPLFGWIGNAINIIALISGVIWVYRKLNNSSIIESIASIKDAVWIGVPAPYMLFVAAYLATSILVTALWRAEGEDYRFIWRKHWILFIMTAGGITSILVQIIIHIFSL